jgi:hypothetical protein
VEKETLYYRDIVGILEPNRSSVDIERELEELAERKLVGKPPVVNLEGIGSLGAGNPNNNKELPPGH